MAIMQKKAGNVRATIGVRKFWYQPAFGRSAERYTVKLYKDGSLSVVESPALAVCHARWGHDIFFATGAYISAILYRDAHGHYLGLPKRYGVPILYSGDRRWLTKTTAPYSP